MGNHEVLPEGHHAVGSLVETGPCLMPQARQDCVHCGTRKVHRPRGLCHHCYDQPGVKERYPLAGRRGKPAEYQRVGLGRRLGRDSRGTAALPGTSEKVAEMERRALLGLELWHPDDSRRDED